MVVRRQMLAVVDYLVKGVGIKVGRERGRQVASSTTSRRAGGRADVGGCAGGPQFPFVFGDVSTADIPGGLGALKALPLAGWVQIILFCGLLEGLTEKNEGNFVPGKVPGNVQPDTPLFKAPGKKRGRAGGRAGR